MKRKILGSFLLTAFLITVFLAIDSMEGDSSHGIEKAASKIKPDQQLTLEGYMQEKKERRKLGYAKMDMPEVNAEIERQLRTPVDLENPTYSGNYKISELNKMMQRSQNIRTDIAELNFVDRGPGNVAGRTRAILIDKSDPTGDTWVAGATSGGLWKTTDRGVTWRNVTGELPNLSISWLVSSENNPSVIYAGTGEHFTTDWDGAGIFKSTDNGETWSQIVDVDQSPDFLNVSRLIVDPNDENIVVATTRNSVWGDGLEAAIYRTTNGGQTWTAVRTSTSERYDDIDYVAGNFNVQFVAIDRGLVLKSTDGGITWNESSEGIIDGGRIEITTSPVDPNRIWASMQGGASGSGSDLYVSKNQGESWQLVLEVDGGENVHFLGGQGWYDNIITAHPFDRDIVYVGGVNLFRFKLEPGSDQDGNLLRVTNNVSDAYGQFDNINTFSNADFVNKTGIHPDQHNIIISETNPEDSTFRMIVTNDGGVFESILDKAPGIEDSAFIYRSYGYNTTQFYGADKAPGEDRYIGGMQDNSTWYTPAGVVSDAATNYNFAFGGDGFEAVWNNRDGNLMIGSIQFNQLVRTTDGGQSWFLALNGLTDVGSGQGPFRSRIANSKDRPDRLYAVGSRGVYYSNDFGGSWNLTALVDQWSFNNSVDVEVSDANPDIVWAGGNLSQSQKLFVSKDAGISFTAVENYNGEPLGFCSGFKPHPTEEGTAFALFSFQGRPKVIKTTDFGQSWTDISGFEGDQKESTNGFPDVAVNSIIVFPNDTDRIWVGTEIGIVESLNGGETWNLPNSNFPAVNVHDFKIQDNQVVIATYGRGIWSVDIEGLAKERRYAPNFVSVATSPDGSQIFDLQYLDLYDSVQILANEERVFSVGANDTLGTFSVSVDNLGIDGEINFTALGFIAGNGYKSGAIKGFVFEPLSPVESYTTKFSDKEADDFIADGFSIRDEPDFSSTALHSDHDYRENGNFFYLIKSPIIVSETNPIISYKNVAIVEPGEPGTVFGDFEFWDYVIVEGSTDGVNWIPLIDGYDCDVEQAWRTAFLNGLPGRENIMLPQEIDISQTFDPGTTIFVRFRLFSDQTLVGWGWAIDDLIIQADEEILSVDKLVEEISIYPNPASEKINVEFPSNSGKISTLQLINQEGKIVKQIVTQPGSNSIEISVGNLQRGIYFLKLGDGDSQITRKVIIE